MNHSSRILTLILAAFAGAAFSGCLDVETKTTVNRDGTLNRTVTFKGDSARVYRGDFPLTVDSLWSSSIRKVDEKKFEYSASRIFDDAAALNEAIKSIPYETLPVHVELERSFRWFVTDYRYKETYKRWNPFDNIPLTDFVSPTELEAAIRHEVDDEPYATKGDSLALSDVGDRFEQWETRNIFESFFALFLEGLRNLNDPRVKADAVAARKEEIFKALQEPLHEGKFDTLTVILDRVLQTRLAGKALAANAEGYDLFEKQHDFKGAISANSYKVSIEMPGIITETNAKSIEGNTVHFSDFNQISYVMDYEMRVTSRVNNWWAVAVTAAVLALGGVALVVAKRKRR